MIRWLRKLFPRETPHERWLRLSKQGRKEIIPLEPVPRAALLAVGMQRINKGWRKR